MTEPPLVLVEKHGRVGTLTLNRPDKANAQNVALLKELDAGWQAHAHDEDVRVILVQANGKHFSAGHDLGKGAFGDEGPLGKDRDAKLTVEKMYRWEQEFYLGYCLRWRNIPKPSIAAVQGKCIAAGLMVAWPCDLILAAEDATFSDPVIHLGIGAGVEYTAHFWELGHRLAKEMLLTGRPFTAEEARQAGMINRVVPTAELRDTAMSLAGEISERDPFALLAAKRVINQAMDVAGFSASVQGGFDLHQLGHGNAISHTGRPTMGWLDDMKKIN